MLVHRGAKVNVQDHKKNTPAMVAAFFNKPKILQYLIDEGVDLTIRNNEDKDAYDVADEKEHLECRSIVSRAMERIGIYRKPSASNQIDNDLSKNFEAKNRIR
jgi:ankyrin repeat protein